MSSDNNISIALIGIPAIEEKRLNAAFIHSQSRQTSYRIANIADAPQVLMVNADEPASLIEWRQYRNTLESEGKQDPPSVLVSKSKQFETIHYQVKRPLISSRAISVLDQVSTREFSLEEEVAINGNADIDKTTDTQSSAVALVVDDSLPVRIQMDQALKPYTSRVDFAESGEEAFEYINTNDYQIIFLDVVLPGMDGYEVCKVIKQGKAKNTPIIMLTGNSSPADKIKGKLAGCDTYLIKPVGQTIFNEVVSQYLKETTDLSAVS